MKLTSSDPDVRGWLEELLSENNGQLPGHELYTLMEELLGGKANVNKRLAKSGYDAITHTGGRITGGAPHNVVIALDPDKVYKPHIAQEFMDVPPAAMPQPIQRTSPLLAALLGHNAVARSHTN